MDSLNQSNEDTQNGIQIFDVILTGQGCVGKTAFLNRFRSGHYTPEYKGKIILFVYQKCIHYCPFQS